MSHRQANRSKTVEVRGQRYPIERWMTVGGQEFGIIKRLTEGRERFLVFDKHGGPRGCLRALHIYDRSAASRARLRTLERLNDSRLPRIITCLHEQTRTGILFHWVEGTPLESLMAEMRCGKRERPTSDIALRMFRSLVHVGRKVNDALKVVHGDIKPANIIVPTGNITNLTLIDFGSAWGVERAAQDAGTGDGITRHVYAAPEQRQGEPIPDFRADLFAVGVIGYELFTGTTPYEGMGGGAGGTPACAAEFAGTLQRPSTFRRSNDHLPTRAWDAVDRALTRSLALERGERYPNWSELCQEVDVAYGALLHDNQLGHSWQKLFRWIARAGELLRWPRS